MILIAGNFSACQLIKVGQPHWNMPETVFLRNDRVKAKQSIYCFFYGG